MSREIKFRAWDGERMWYLSNMFVGVGQIGFSDEHYVDLNDMDQEQATLMQYTGLKDKNGVEIYECDIITRNSGGLMGDGEPMYTGKIEFRRQSFMVAYSSVKVQGTDFVKVVEHEGHLVNSSELEVIGNIYENLELLETQS